MAALPLMGMTTPTGLRCPRALHAPLIQEAAASRRAPMEAAAVEFLRFLTGPRGREILQRHRFILPDVDPR
jgi:ABC-type molybdate transport system substrate-binding protein